MNHETEKREHRARMQQVTMLNKAADIIGAAMPAVKHMAQ
jgi:hypothetical protein